MNENREEMVLSELADGELDADRAGEVLLGVLDDAERRERLKELLGLRQLLKAWRRQRPGPVAMTVPVDRPRLRAGRLRRLGGLAAAAAIGGIVAIAGLTIARGGWRPPRGDRSSPGAIAPERMQQIAKVFELHESVAGPLKWYAADEREIRLASAEGGRGRAKPVAIVLSFTPAAGKGAARKVVVVCRDNEEATVDLPGSDGDFPGLSIRLVPQRRGGAIDVRYALALVQPETDDFRLASLAGERTVDAEGAPLGQLALKDRLFSVGANAWVIREGRR